jgi:hypothetical protein
VSEKNPFGAKCIFCKSAMVTLDDIESYALYQPTMSPHAAGNEAFASAAS